MTGEGNGPSIRWIEIVPLQNGETLYLVGTSTGLYSTTELNGTATQWGQEGAEEIGNVVVPMVKSRSTDGQVVIATHGNGTYGKKFDNVLALEPNLEFENVTVFNRTPEKAQKVAQFLNGKALPLLVLL